MNIRNIIVLFSVLFTIKSCENTDSNKEILKIKFSNFSSVESDYLDVKYFVTEYLNINTKTENQNIKLAFSESNINIPSSFFLLSKKIKDIKSSLNIKVKKNSENFLVLLLDNQIIDFISLNDYKNGITLKPLNYYSESSQINSNQINLIDVPNFLLKDNTINNATLISIENESMILANSNFNNVLINLNFIKNDITFDDVELEDSYLINIDNSIEIDNNFSIESTYIGSKINNNPVFVISNSQALINNSYFDLIPLIFSGLEFNLGLTNSFFIGNETIFDFDTNHSVEIISSYFIDNNTLFKLIDGEINVSKSTFVNNKNIFQLSSEKVYARENDIIGLTNSKLLLTKYLFYLPLGKNTTLIKNNIELQSDSYVIDITSGINGTFTFLLDSNYLDFNTENIFTKVKDKNHNNFNNDIGAEVIILNQQENHVIFN